jgi:hypothetical protein
MLPKENYKYIPLALFPNLMFEFRLNPYAFFTSGNIGYSPFVANTPSSRNWTVTKFEMWADIYYFENAVMTSILNQAA